MHALIYTGATGAGHTLAARSIGKALEEAGEEVTIVDGFKEGGKLLDKTITKGYEKLVENWPRLYRMFYEKFDKPSKTSETILKQATSLLKNDFLENIRSNNPDLIISTHPIITNILGRLKDQGLIDVPILAFVTDYVIHDVYLRDSIDSYVVANDYTLETMLEKGISKDKIYPYGIPIREEFRETRDEKKENETLKLLLMAGSIGSKQLKKAYRALIEAEPELSIYIVCGNNDQIREELTALNEKQVLENKDVEILGYVDNIAELMEESDLLITKPGGLTSTEAISKHIPIIIPYTYPGVEEYNRDYLVKAGMALEVDKISDLTELIEYLSKNSSVIEAMKQKMVDSSKAYSICDTVKLCQNLANAQLH